MRIQELERQTGMDRATIRFYEKEGLIEPKRSENGYRDYTDENAAELKKIRLLRQLGMSVFTIRQLQQGSADFLQTLADQVQRLSDQIEESKRARAVCQIIRDDGAQYGTLDAEHYLQLIQTIQTDAPKKEFQENIPREIHPWRRWLARTLDYWWLGNLVNFVIIVLLRVRPLPNDFMYAVIAVLSGALLIPFEAFLLSRWGTTPGKFVMGIRLESANGGNLPLEAALRRSWRVYKEGMFFCIPYVEILGQWNQYLRLTGRSIYRFAKKEDIPDPAEMSWDDETEIVYSPVTGKRGLLLAVLIAVVFSISLFAGFDSIRPRYRSEELTIAQFAENYNHSLTVFNENAIYLDKLQSDGTKYPLKEEDKFYNVTTGEIGYVPTEFEYEIENGYVKSVTIREEYNNVFLVSAINAEMMNLTFALALSQPDFTYADLQEMATMLDLRKEWKEADIGYGNLIRVSWSVEAENCEHIGGGTYMKDDETLPSTMRVSFTVTVL